MSININADNWLAIISIVISALSVIITFGISIKSIKIASKTLEANNKMVEASTRPYIMPFYDSFAIGNTPAPFIAVKNFGLSGARITKFSYQLDYKDGITALKGETCFAYLRTLENFYLAPSQTKFFAIDPKESQQVKNIIFDLAYETTDGKKFEDKISCSLEIIALKQVLQLNPKPDSLEFYTAYETRILLEILRHIV